MTWCHLSGKLSITATRRHFEIHDCFSGEVLRRKSILRNLSVASIQYLPVNQNFGNSYCAFGLLTVLFSDVTRWLSAGSLLVLISIQIRSVAQSCPTLCDPMNPSTPDLPVHHQLPEFTETHVHLVSDAIQPSHPLSSPSPPAPNPSQHQSLFQWVNSSHEVAKVLEFQL